MYRGVTRLGYARISHGGLSDTEMQLGRFRILSGDDKGQDNPVLTKSSTGVPKHVQFSDRYILLQLCQKTSERNRVY